jgi:hypothetical protein
MPDTQPALFRIYPRRLSRRRRERILARRRRQYWNGSFQGRRNG